MNTLHELYLRGRFSTVDEVLDRVGDARHVFDESLANQRLKAWCDSATAGDWSLFRELLHGRGFSPDDVRRRLGEPFLLKEPFPSWLEALTGAIDGAKVQLRSMSSAGIRSHTRPFGYITEALAQSAESLRDTPLSKSALDRFLPKARSDLRDHLCDRIEAILAAPLYQSFKSWLQLGDEGKKDALLAHAIATGEDDSHKAYLEDFLDRGLEALWVQRPVLARLLGNTIDQWIASTRELIERFDSSQGQILGFIGDCPHGLVVERVSCGLSDLHNAGRSVCILSLRGLAPLVYKPRSVCAESAWEYFVNWVNQHLPSATLRPMRVLDCDGYGWCEFIEGPLAVDEQQARKFFYRAGILLGLLHLLAATDMHEENLVACGEHPVLVDLEMLLQPGVEKRVSAGADPLRAHSQARDLITESVLETGLLPVIVKTPETATIGQGGLSHHALFGPRKLEWGHVNRVDMTPTLGAGDRLSLSNLPSINGVPAKLHDFWGMFQRGVEDGMHLAVSHKYDLLRPGGPLSPFEGIPIRITLRPTRYYEMLLRRLMDFRRMSDTLAWSCQADFSSRFDFSPDQPIWPADYSTRERVDLLALNVPHFEVESDGHLELDAKIHDASRQRFISGYQRARARIFQVDEASIREQLNILELSALSFDIGHSQGITPASENEVQDTPDVVASSKDGEMEVFFRAEIKRIFGILKRSAIRAGGGCSWLGLSPVGDTDAIALRPLGHALYDGTMGVALFLAAASVAIREEECQALCEEAMAATRWYIKNQYASGFARTLGMGGTGGIGSVIYGLTSIAQILSDSALLEDALDATRLITDRMITSDRVFDLSRGCAGTMLALLRLYKETKDREVMARAIDCAEHLLQNRPDHTGALWKRNREPMALAGMSHGASGYALAFFRMHSVTGDDRYLQVVKDCLTYERSVFSPEKNNWPDLRPNNENVHMEYPVSWCHGAVGIAFARQILIEGGYDDTSLGVEYRTARETSRNFCGHQSDSLCCGKIGAIELLMRRGIDETSEVPRQYAEGLLEDLILRSHTRGSYRWQGGHDIHNPGLHRGISGIGYILARRVVGDALPDVLTLS